VIFISVIAFAKTYVHIVQNRLSVFFEIQIHVIVRITFRVQIKFHVGQFAIVESVYVFGHDVLPTCLQSKDNVSRLFKLSSGLNGPRVLGCALQ